MKYRKNRVKVFVRILPTDAPYPSNVQLIDNKILKVRRDGLRDLKLMTDGIFGNASQEETYQIITETELVKKLFAGNSASILTYGINTAGKSFTLFGGLNYNQRGLLPRALTDIYKEIRLLPRNCSATVKISAFDLTGDVVHDLLSPSEPDYVDCKNMANIAEHVAVIEKDAICLFLLAMVNKKALRKKRKLQRATDWGHMIVNVNLEIKLEGYSSDKSVVANLKFVELAGAVGVLTEPVTNDQLIARESISLLEHSMTNPQNCPSVAKIYCVRCKLTHILNDDVCGRTSVVLVLAIRLEHNYMKSTIQTMMFAQRLSQLPVKSQSTVPSESASRPREKLTEDVRALKLELYRRDLVCNRKPLNYSTPNQSQKREIFRQVQEYLEEKNPTLEVDTLAEMQMALESMRAIYRDAETRRSLQQQLENILEEPVDDRSSESSPVGSEVGSLDGKGFGVGSAAPDLIATSPLPTNDRPKSAFSKLTVDSSKTEKLESNLEHSVIDESAIQRWAAFEDFKHRAGRQGNELFLQQKALTEKKKLEFNRVLERLREIKRDLRGATEWYRELCLRVTDLTVMEEIAELLERVEGLTADHERCAEECIKALGEVRAAQRIAHRQRQQYLQAFDSWYEKKLAVIRYQQMVGSQEYHEEEIEFRPKTPEPFKTACQAESSRADDEVVFQKALEHVNKWVKYSRSRSETPKSRIYPLTFDFLQDSK